MNIERVKAIYAEIEKYEVRLAPDPRSLGPLYLQNTIAECRNFLNLVSRIQLEVHREKQDVARRLRASEASYEVAFSEVLANDERVRRLPSIEDRKAVANVILRENLSGITALKAELQDLEYVEKAVRHRHRELTSTMSEIKLQRSLIRDEIDSGAMYGDERGFDHERKASHGPIGLEDDGIDEAALDALLDQERGAVPEPPAPVPSPPPPPPAPPVEATPEVAAQPDDEAKVRDFLDSPSGPTLEDFDDVFDNL